MVSTHVKTTTRKNVVTQTELPCKHAVVQVPGCRECLNLSVMSEGSSDETCVHCDQLDDLLSLVRNSKKRLKD